MASDSAGVFGGGCRRCGAVLAGVTSLVDVAPVTEGQPATVSVVWRPAADDPDVGFGDSRRRVCRAGAGRVAALNLLTGYPWGTIEGVETDLALMGMSCASCAAKVERGLNKLDGVQASVNFAVEQAHVEHDSRVSAEDLMAAVASTGYRAAVIDHNHHGAHGAHAGHDHMSHDVPTEQLRPRLIGSAVLAIPVLVLSMVMPLQFPGWQWVVLALTAPIVFWGGYPFHKAALNSARHGSSTMDTLVSLGTLAAFVWSTVVVVTGMGKTAGARLLRGCGRGDGVPAGWPLRREQGQTIGRSGSASAVVPGARDATVVRGDDEVRIPVGELAVGDVIVVRPGERVATDGVVVEGASALDTAAMTGESVPVDVRPGDEVLGGAVNTYGRILVRAEKVGSGTQLARMAKMVADAQNGKASIQRLADRVSAVFVPAVLVISALTLAGWLLTGTRLPRRSPQRSPC